MRAKNDARATGGVPQSPHDNSSNLGQWKFIIVHINIMCVIPGRDRAPNEVAILHPYRSNSELIKHHVTSIQTQPHSADYSDADLTTPQDLFSPTHPHR